MKLSRARSRRSVLERLEQRCLMHAEALFHVESGSTTAYTDSAGEVWAADSGFSGGGTDTSAFPVAGTSDPKLFQTRRTGTFSYSKAVPDGEYTLNLLFADWRNPGERKFNVVAEGQTILSEFDISATAGKNTALIKSFDITVTGGVLNLQFLNGSLQTPTLSGFELFAAEATAPLAPTNLQASARASSSVNLSWSDVSTNNETGYQVERSTDGGATFATVVTNPANDTTYVDGGLSASTAYTFRVRAVNDTGVSDWSNLANATTPANSPTPTPPPNAGVDVRVDAGNTGSFTDTSGKVWAADAGFTGGWFANTSFAVANTNDDPLYLSRRAGDFTFSRTVPNGDYTLKLLFADYLTAGQRKFNVVAEGQQVLTNYDIVADAGTKTAITKSFPVTITDGKIDVSFTSVVNYATLSALQLVAVAPAGTDGVPAQPTDLKATAGVGKISLAWKDNASNEQSYEIWRQINGGAITFVATRPANSTTYDDLNLDPAKTYTYFVRGINATGASAPSFSATAKPLTGSTTINWTTGKNMPLNRAEGGAAAANGKFYIFGGFIDGQLHVTTQLDIYDPATNTWTTGAPCPAPTTHASTAVDGNTIWVAGFFYNNGVTASRLVYKYDTVTNTWSAGPQLPAARGAGALAIVGRELHYWGGLTGPSFGAADHWRLNLDNTAAGWVTDTPVPSAINHQAGISLNGKLYSIGGMIDKQENTGNQSTVRVYDPATRQWSTAKSLPVGRAHIGPATFIRNGRIVIAGGNINGSDLTRDVLEYNPDTNTWTNLTPLPAARKSSNAAFINGKVVVIGGNNPVPSNTTWIGT